MPNPTDTEYLRRRLEQSQASIFRSGEERLAAFLKEYETANKEILDELARLFAKYGQDGELTLTEMHRYSRFDKLNTMLQEIGKELGASEEKFLRNTLGTIWTETQSELMSSLGVRFTMIPRSRLEAVMEYPWSGANFSDRVWNNKEQLIRTLRETLIRGFVRGDGFSRMSADIRDKMLTSAYNARRLVRTESMYFINRAQLDQYERLGVKKVEYLTGQDERVCPTCSPYDGTVYPLGSEPIVPLHPSCRCTYIPIIDPTSDRWAGLEEVVL